jgi:hypothetical protein
MSACLPDAVVNRTTATWCEEAPPCLFLKTSGSDPSHLPSCERSHTCECTSKQCFWTCGCRTRKRQSAQNSNAGVPTTPAPVFRELRPSDQMSRTWGFPVVPERRVADLGSRAAQQLQFITQNGAARWRADAQQGPLCECPPMEPMEPGPAVLPTVLVYHGHP